VKFAWCLLWVIICLCTPAAHAQGPVLDPTFLAGQVFKPAYISQALPQSDGKLLLVTDATHVGGRPANQQLARLLANSNQVDTVFAANVAGLQGTVLQAAVLPNNHVVLISRGGNLSLGGVTRRSILGLNPDGTVDLNFNAITTVNLLTSVVAQPDGKVLVAGGFMQWAPGQPAGCLVRLMASGALDAGFQTALGQGFGNVVDFLSLQAGGSIIAAGRFSTVDGQVQHRLARLLPSGAFDASFRPLLPPNSPSASIYPVGALTQPDGKVVIASFLSPVSASWRPLERLLPSGARDPSFQSGTNFPKTFSPWTGASPLCLLANGKLLVANEAGSYDGTPVGQLVRLTAVGLLDPAFPNRLAVRVGIEGLNYGQLGLTLLPGGEVLAAGWPARFGYGTAPTSLARLDTTSGGRNASFAPRVQLPGEVREVLRQSDGRYLVGGLFTEINGSDSPFLARLTARGVVEPTFTDLALPDNPVNGLALQPDGKVLVVGTFQTISGSVYPGVVRLLPSGVPDPAFVPDFAAGTVPYPSITKLALEPSGHVLLLGNFSPASVGGTGTEQLVRLLGASGQQDPTFAPAYSQAEALLVQPDGRIVLAGYSLRPAGGGSSRSLVRLQANGNVDFVGPFSGIQFAALAHDPATGAIYAGGNLNSVVPFVLRFGSSGAQDMGYVPIMPSGSSARVHSLAVQPDGKLLVGGDFQFNSSQLEEGVRRLLPSGAFDPTFTPPTMPSSTFPGVLKLLPQADGALVVAGGFGTLNGAPVVSLARLVDASVLAYAPARTPGQLHVWPVPAREVLHVAPDPAARPTRVMLLDALGRQVRSLAVTPLADDIALRVVGLPAGIYFLRLEWATGAVTRRVSVGAE
jgi:uncharacterized delta-60 repeat protein